MRDNERNEYAGLPLPELRFLEHLAVLLREKDPWQNLCLDYELGLIRGELGRRQKALEIQRLTNVPQLFHY